MVSPCSAKRGGSVKTGQHHSSVSVDPRAYAALVQKLDDLNWDGTADARRGTRRHLRIGEPDLGSAASRHSACSGRLRICEGDPVQPPTTWQPGDRSLGVCRGRFWCGKGEREQWECGQTQES